MTSEIEILIESMWKHREVGIAMEDYKGVIAMHRIKERLRYNWNGIKDTEVRKKIDDNLDAHDCYRLMVKNNRSKDDEAYSIVKRVFRI